jgi:hypothetical protein
MKRIIMQSEIRRNSLRTKTFAEQGNRWSALFCADVSSSDQALLLTPIRIQGSDPRLVSSRPHLEDILKQTINLRNKITALDRLQLVSTELSRNFAAARLFVFGDISEGEREDWWFCRQALRLLQDCTGRAVIAQVDYDQRRLHPIMSGIFDSIDFATKHEPAVISTVVCFRTIVEHARPPDDALAWCVKGAGQLGGRIIRRVAPGAQHVYVAERIPGRQLEVASLPGVSIVSDLALAGVSADTLVFAADSGSLNMQVAKMIAVNERLAAVGGPEAGLDRCVNAIQTITAAGKSFVPSVLCGSLGLISNLEEVLNHPLDIAAQADRLQSVVRAMVVRAADLHIPFHEICGLVLRGVESI